jgi:endo-1,4-beta-xylanase
MGASGVLRRRIGGLGLALLATGLAGQLAPAYAAPAKETLRAVPQGAAVRFSALRDDGRYRDTFLREFDSLTPENELKMAAVQPRRGQFDFGTADALVDFARRNGRAVHGHALVWGLSLPLWLVDHGSSDQIGLRLPPIVLPALPGAVGKGLSNGATVLTGWRRDELVAIMRTHIATVMRHFAGRVGEWDVVNEPMAGDGGPSPSVWRRFIGPDYVELALRAARAADPKAKLFINEYGVEGPGRKLEGFVELVRNLQKRDVPLDGIGLQMHSHILGYHDQATIESTMRRFAAMGLEVQVTEMDVGTSLLDVAGVDRLSRQAAAYGAAARACNAVTACKRFTTWGITDRLSWIGAGEAPLLFDADYKPKPALDAVRNAFAPRAKRASAPAAQPRRWRWRAGTGARCGWGSCSGLRAGRG